MSNNSDSSTPDRAKRNPTTIDLDPSEVKVTDAAAEANRASGPKPASDADDGPANREGSARDQARRSWSDNASHALTPALSGATAAALILTGAWLFGLSGDNRTPATVTTTATAPMIENPATTELTARLAKLEADVAAKLNAPAPPAATAVADPALTKRIDQTDASIKSVTEAVAALRTDVERLSASSKDAAAAPREVQAPSFDPAPLEQRMTQIETAQRALTQAIEQAARPFDDAPLRRALAASALDSAVRAGEPFADLLAAAKAATPSAALQPLDAFAASGVPNDAALSRELLALLPQLAPSQPKQSAPTTSSAGGVLDRLQESASRLVKVERLEQASPEPSASTAKVAAAARNGDLAAAKAALMELPPAQRTPAQGWLDRVQARDAARESARQFAAAQIAALPAQAR